MANVFQVSITAELYADFLKILKLNAHAKSCRKIGNEAEAKTYQQKADKLAVAWFRKARFKS